MPGHNSSAFAALRWLSLVLGSTIVLIGALHILFGPAIIPGAGAVNATLDSEDRFYGAIFVGYGLAWIWCATDLAARLVEIRVVAAIFLLGGIARLISIAVMGWPEMFFVILMLVELLAPVLVFWLARQIAGR